MNFETVYNKSAGIWPNTFMIFAFLLLIAAVFLLMSALGRTDKSKMTRAVWGTTCGLLGFIIGITLFAVSPNATNAENLEKNLKQKYDIASIVDDDPKYKIYPQLEREQLILVEAKDGKQGAFFLTQNHDTSEPTLHELVDNEASEPLTLEDITK